MLPIWLSTAHLVTSLICLTPSGAVGEPALVWRPLVSESSTQATGSGVAISGYYQNAGSLQIYLVQDSGEVQKWRPDHFLLEQSLAARNEKSKLLSDNGDGKFNWVDSSTQESVSAFFFRDREQPDSSFATLQIGEEVFSLRCAHGQVL